MVASGDLGVEVPSHKVPVYQKMIVEKCIEHSKPVINPNDGNNDFISHANKSRGK